MTDPLHTDAAPSPDGPGPIDRDERIEQLLLTGLDYYFARDFERAINVWTRVAFLERGHSRARAYIERARGALAERQRESEELLHRGVEAFNRGDADGARLLIDQAVEQIGPNDVALALLERLNRLAPSSATVEAPRADTVTRASGVREAREGRTARRFRPWLIVATGLLAAAGVVALAGLGLEAWFLERPAAGADLAPSVRDEPLPIARPAEIALARARSLYGGGHLRDALATLDTIGLADPLRADADELRAGIQRRLLEIAGPVATPVPPVSADPR